MTLNSKQEAFCQHYILLGNGSYAYTLAYGAKGRSAEANAARLLRNDKVLARLSELQAQKSREFAFLGERIINELSAIAFADGLSVLEWVATGEGQGQYQMKSPEQMHPTIRSAIAEVRQTRFGVTVKLGDKIAALGHLARILGLNSDLNIALATLRKYGINLVAENGQWKLIDNQQPLIEEDSDEDDSDEESENPSR